jgi:ribose 5-phosphate isomerase B
MLAMGARVVGSELAKMIVRTFLTSNFQGERHQRRVNQINEIDDQYHAK